MRPPPRFWIASFVSIGMASPSLAASMQALQGAWTMKGTACSDTFTKKGGTIRFRNRTASTTTGILVSGSKVAGPQVTCTTQKVRDSGDYFSAYLSCADAIMFSGISVSFRIIDKDTIERFDSQFPEESVRYYRCKL